MKKQIELIKKKWFLFVIGVKAEFRELRSYWKKFLKEKKDRAWARRQYMEDAINHLLLKKNLKKIEEEKRDYFSEMRAALTEDPNIIRGVKQIIPKTKLSERITVAEQLRRHGLQETSEEHWKHCPWNPNREKESEKPRPRFKVKDMVIMGKDYSYIKELYLSKGTVYEVLESGLDNVLIKNDLGKEAYYSDTWFVLYEEKESKNER